MIGYGTGENILTSLPFWILNMEPQKQDIQMKNEHVSVTAKCDINFTLDFPHSMGRKSGIS